MRGNVPIIKCFYCRSFEEISISKEVFVNLKLHTYRDSRNILTDKKEQQTVSQNDSFEPFEFVIKVGSP